MSYGRALGGIAISHRDWHNPRVRVAANLEAFRADPIGACHIGRTWIHYCASSTLWDLLLHGRPDREDARTLVRSLALEFEAPVRAHAFYLDARHLEGVDPDAFTELIALYRDRFVEVGAIYTRLGLIIPTGVEGAIVTGFYGPHEPPFPCRVLPDPAAAEAWLGAPLGLDEALMAIVAEQRGAATIVLSLRNLLASAISPSQPEAIARALGMSARTLQRRLRGAGTSLQKELSYVRIEIAKKRLLETETPVTVIALDLGFATSQHFSRQFRVRAGVSPSEWRARFRRT